ncbi:Predicted dehydrogenase and related proteins [Streptococcus suis 05ZYH33]|nr:Predicted dehydrogenase and related proteins [Streptococcus suis 05ZYH33]
MGDSGTGVIANELVQAFQAMGGNLYSVANRTYDHGCGICAKIWHRESLSRNR